jgi:hypothetical protein
LPSSLGGDIYSSQGATGARPIGHYQETLQPILVDVTGDQVPDFVGTTGVATFEFFVGTGRHALGTITTVNTSYVQGVTAAGQMMVASQGTIAGGTQWLRGLSGGFISQSTVGLYPTFEMETTVHFSVGASLQGALVALLAAGTDHAAAGSESASANDRAAAGQRCDGPQQVNAPHGGLSQPSGSDDDRQDQKSRHERSIDKSFAEDVDWCGETLAARSRGRNR